MSAPTAELTWHEFNQQFLAHSLGHVRGALRRHIDSRSSAQDKLTAADNLPDSPPAIPQPHAAAGMTAILVRIA